MLPKTVSFLTGVLALLTIILPFASAYPHGGEYHGNGTDPGCDDDDHGNANRTFILTTVSDTTNYTSLVNRPVLFTPPQGIGSVVVYNTTHYPTNTTTRLKAFIYNGDIYRKCETSPTGACLGFLSKAYAGALTGWYFDFSDDETEKILGPTPPIRGSFSVADDPDKPGRKILLSGTGSNTWTLCSNFDGQFGVNSMAVPPFAHNGESCKYWGFKFKVKYTGRE